MAIAEKLDALQSKPSLHLEMGHHKEVAEAVGMIVPAVLGLFMNAIVENVLREPSKTWFAEDRHRRFGMTLAELEKKVAPTAYENAQPGFEKLKQALTTHKTDEGPFVLGSTPSYGDLIVGALFEGLRRCRPDQLEKMLGYDQSFRDVYEACKQWLHKDD